MFGLGIWELLVVLLIVLLFFGAKRLPEIGSSLGKGIREFKDSIEEIDGDDRKEIPRHERERDERYRGERERDDRYRGEPE